MKKIITIALFLCSLGVSAQKVPITITTNPPKQGHLELDSLISSKQGQFIGSGSYSDLLARFIKPEYYYIQSINKVIIKMSYPDSTGLVKGWIDKKEITWTSDSTFTYKTENP